jgi:phage terminase large subunit-like protein
MRSPGNRTMHKGKSRGRIDLAVALWMAVSRAAAGDTSRGFYSSPLAEDLEFSAF